MINIAVAGCGYWGPNLIRNFYSLPDCSVLLVCDTDENQLKRIKSLYPSVKTTRHFEDIINDANVEAIAIATPVSHHFEMGLQSLQAGKHTFLEKPMARSVSECETLLKVSKKHNLTLMVGHTFVYAQPVRKIKEIIQAGDLGEIQYVSAQRLNLGLFQKDINVAWDLAPHDISIILYALGEMPMSVGCHGKAHLIPGIEDVTNITLNFGNGGFGMIHSSWLDPNKVRLMEFVGTDKMLVYDDVEPIEKIKIYDKHVTIPPRYDTFGEFQYSYHYGDMYCPYIKQNEPLNVECRHFLDCIQNSSKCESSGLEGLKVVQILEAASRSLKNGGVYEKILP